MGTEAPTMSGLATWQIRSRGRTTSSSGLTPLISISGPPDAAFARSLGASWVLRMVTGALSYRIRAKRRQVHYSFLFMRANGDQLTEITSLIDDGIIRPVVDRVFPFASTKEAMAYVEAGRAKGKVVVSFK